MQKELSTHNFAKLLLSKNDKPLFIEEFYETNYGKPEKGYSTIIGVKEDTIEHGAIIETNYLKGNPNDKKYLFGEAEVEVEIKGKLVDVNLNIEDIILIIFEKESVFLYDFDFIIGLKETEGLDFYFDFPIKIIQSNGFKKEYKKYTLNEAVQFYIENFSKIIFN